MAACLTCRRTFKTIHGLRGHEQFKHHRVAVNDPSRTGNGRRHNHAGPRAAGEQLQRQPKVTVLDPFYLNVGIRSMEERCAKLERDLSEFRAEQRELLRLLRRDPMTGCLVLDEEGAACWGFEDNEPFGWDDVGDKARLNSSASLDESEESGARLG